MRKLFFFVLATLFSLRAMGATYYVNNSNLTPNPPYSTWDTAATNIQDAINITTSGDLVLVTNGVYAAGGLAVTGGLTNRVALTNAITVQSVNGPGVTTILGAGVANGVNPVRCAWLTNGASLVGFTLTAGATFSSGNSVTTESGGGVWCASSNALVSNCVIVTNSAFWDGGGVYQGTVQYSLIASNFVSIHGGAASSAILLNCTIISNNAPFGVYGPLAMTNCIIYYNRLSENYNVSGSAFSHCCTTPSLSGTGNFTAPPQFWVDGSHLASGSPCIGTGTGVLTGTDIFGLPWASPPSVGCAEWQPAPLLTPPQMRLTGYPAGFTVGRMILNGQAPFSFSWIKDGNFLQDNGHFSSTQTSNLVATGVSLADAGSYQVVVSNAFGMATSAVVTLTIHCVNIAGNNPSPPYTTWNMAATNIQDAVNAANAEDIILVTNGIYATGGATDGFNTNRVFVLKPVLITSVNGPYQTIIQGASDLATRFGPAAARCAWMTTNSAISGFTLQSGSTSTYHGEGYFYPMTGGGVYGLGTNITVGNCILKGNQASYEGGGAYAVNLFGCLIYQNSATNAATSQSGNGAGVANCTVYNSFFNGNTAGRYGAAAYGGNLINCTIISNSCYSSLYGYGPAVYGANITNCLIVGNLSNGNRLLNYSNCNAGYCCSDPLPAGAGNIDVNPLLLADGVHLSTNSPCIGAGTTNGLTGTDFEGQPWNNPPAMGCDEWQPTPTCDITPALSIGAPPHCLGLNATVAGQPPFTLTWTKNGIPLQDNGHYTNSATANLIVGHFGPDDGATYQLIASNSFGMATSPPVSIVIHAVDAAGSNPIAPYLSWSNAAVTIQDAVNAANPGDIVLVTDGVYATGGMPTEAGNVTNRVVINKPITVVSANGYRSTVIQGALDPATNGPTAVRCVALYDGATLNGFTLMNGATFNSTLLIHPNCGFGGGVCGFTSNSQPTSLVINCEFTNNFSLLGGGMFNGIARNSLFTGNSAPEGGGVASSTLFNCTVINNVALSHNSSGGGVYEGYTYNSIVVDNFDAYTPPQPYDDFYFTFTSGSYDCTSTWSTPTGTNNLLNIDPNFLDLFHISAFSPCVGKGWSGYASGYDLDGEPWNNPPSMGCDEVVPADLNGPLTANLFTYSTNYLVNHYGAFHGNITGAASRVQWDWGNGVVYTNSGYERVFAWTNPGTYNVVFTVFNNDNPAGVSATNQILISPLAAPQLQPPQIWANQLTFQFPGQYGAQYTVQVATNLAPPAAWTTLQTIYVNYLNSVTITDSVTANVQRFYRIVAQ